MNKETKKISVRIANREYPVVVSDNEVSKINQIEKDLNERIRKMQMTYKNLDTQDCISMVLLTHAIENSSKAPQLISEIEEKINSIAHRVREAIAE